MKRRSTFALAACAVLCSLLWLASRREGTRSRPPSGAEETHGATAAEVAPAMESPLLVSHRVQERLLVDPEGGPRASGPSVKLQENPPELQMLSIAGLEPGHGTRDRWQYLAVSDVDSAAIAPIEYEVEVPGYRLRKERVPIPRLTDRLAEVVLELASSWGEVEVRVLGSSQVPSIGLDPEQIIGVVYLRQPDRDPVEFALHARVLGGAELVAGIPAGSYDAVFEARDAYYETEAQRIEVGPERCLLELDCSDSGTLLIAVEDEGKVHDQRFVVSIQDEDRAHFYATFDSGPYVVPALFPGTYRIDELEVPGRECVSLGGWEVTVFPGQVSVAFVACGARLPSQAVR